MFSWNEVVTSNPKVSRAFYGKLFGWKCESMDVPGFDYSVFKTGERPVGGLMAVPAGANNLPAVWMAYVTVENVEKSVERVRTLGGRVLKEVTTVPTGRLAIVADPNGTVFGLWEFAV